jgi:hypothetical protein
MRGGAVANFQGTATGIEDFCALVSGSDDIWFATNIETADCMKAAKRPQRMDPCSSPLLSYR